MEKGVRERERKYEITMYKLLIIFAISLFVAIGVGGVFGSMIGYSQGQNDITVPDYCALVNTDNGAEVRCAELGDVSATELCSLFSTPVKNKLKVLIVA